jgi:archaellum component FlaC
MKSENKIMGLVDSLAVMIKQGFDRVYMRFDQVDEEFTKVHKELDAIKNVRLGGHDNRLDNLEDNVRILKTKVGLR